MWTDAARRQYQRLGTRYASDLRDEELALIEPMLPAVKRGGRRRTAALREVDDGADAAGWRRAEPGHAPADPMFRQGAVLCRGACRLPPYMRRAPTQVDRAPCRSPCLRRLRSS
jgi:transposase